MRAGTHVLSLLAIPLNVFMLQALAEEPKSLVALRRTVGSPPQTTMRAHLRGLIETGALTRRRQNDFPGSLDFELTACGRELWEVAGVLRSWLAAAPDGPLQLGSVAAKSAIKALVEGWGTRVVRALAARPLSLTELDGLIAGISYPSLERRLEAMRLTGLIERISTPGRGTPYAVTRWLRLAIGPLAAAARWERLNVAEETPPIARLDAEAAFLLAIPLLSLPVDLSGSCRLTVEIQNGGGERLAGVLVRAGQGRVSSCVTDLQGEADAWASGTAATWLNAVVEQDTERLDLGGDYRLARALLDGPHVALFTTRQRR